MTNSFRSVGISALIFALFAPSMSQAATKKLDLYNPHKRYKDEKVTISDPDSRCTTAGFKALYTSALSQATTDANKLKDGSGALSAHVQKAFDTYKQDIEFGWQAMQQPYCGFGAFGVSAAKKSFQKTLSRARTNFLAVAKGTATAAQEQHAERVVVASTGVSLNKQTNVVAQAPAPTPAPVVVSKSSASPAPAHVELAAVSYGQRGAAVKRLQDVLAAKGYLEADYATGYFGSYTQKALVQFQLDKKIITSKSSAAAGIIGPKTLAALQK